MSVAPIVKWAGGKRRLLSALCARLPAQYGRYIEPCLGGGALALSIDDRPLLLSDLNYELMTMYTAIRSDTDAVIRALERHSDRKEHYYHVRSLNPATLNRSERAARFLFLNRCGFNGLYRVNRSGQFNVPYGRPARRQARIVCDADGLRAAAAHLRRATLSCGDVFETLQAAERGDCAYLDPPYHSADDDGFTSYTPAGFGVVEQERLAQLAFDLQRRGVHVIASNADTPLIRQLYARAHIEVVQCRRSIARTAKARTSVTELIISLPAALSARRARVPRRGASAAQDLHPGSASPGIGVQVLSGQCPTSGVWA